MREPSSRCDLTRLNYHVEFSAKNENSQNSRRLVVDNGLKIPSNVAKKLTRLYLKYKMVGSNGTMIAIRLVRSKLRKREDHAGNEAHTEPSVVQTATPVSAIVVNQQNVITANGTDLRCNTSINTATTTTCNLNSIDVVNGIPEGNLAYANDNGDQFIWQFPPPYPPHTPPPQYSLYNDQDTLVHGLQSDRPGFAKGFRKNLGGRWRRLVKRKPETETCAIPPELKDQLKTIYVY